MKKYRYFSIVMAFLLFIFNSSAQNISVGVRAGMSIPNLTAGGSNENPLNTGFSSRIGADAAIFADFPVNRVFSIRPMIQYSSQGGKKTGLQAFPTPPEFSPYFPGQAPTYLYADFKNESKLNYLLIPVLANFGWNLSTQSPLRFYVNAGPFAGFLLSAKQVTSGSSDIFMDPKGQQEIPVEKQSFDKTNDIKSQLHTFNAGAEANVGIAYNMGMSNIFIEGGFNYGLINIQKGTANGKNHAGAGTLALGYAWKMGAHR